MGRSIGKIKTGGLPMPVVPTENKGIMSGPIRKPKRQGRRMRPRGSRPDVQLGRVTQPDGSTLITYGSSPRRQERRGAIGRRMPPRDRIGIFPGEIPQKDRPLTGGYNPESGVRYTDTGVPTAVQGTERVPVQDPTLGGPPEREVPMPRERRQRITRESDPRGGAPFSPDERGMARDRFFERMFDRADEKKQQKSMGREERRETSRSMRDERSMRSNEPREIDINAERSERGGRRGEGGMRRRKRRGGGMRRRGGRRRDFTRKRSRMEGGRRGRSGREMAEFRDQYVSTLR